MKYRIPLALVTALSPYIAALKLTKREDGPPAVVSLNIERKPIQDPIAHDTLRRRQLDVVQQELDNYQILYYANVTLGTPPQSVRVLVDTGSSDLWINSAESVLCRAIRDPCEESGTYDANSSSTYEYVNTLFNISYVDGTKASGDYVTDTFGIGGIELEGLQFGVGYDSTSEQGVMGIGYPAKQVQVVRAGLDPYLNIPALMADRGHINTIAYSLWLNDLSANTGSILFGGVDTEKYVGTLQTLPIIPDNGGYPEFFVALTGIGINGEAGAIASDINVGVLLDSGSTLTYLPDELAQILYELVGARFSPSTRTALVDCRLGDSDETIDFEFGSLAIRVPLNELVLNIGSRWGQPICSFGIASNLKSSPVLGDTFLRSAYVVFDLENNEISLAQTNFNSTSSNILEIVPGPGGVPNAELVPDAMTTAPVTQGGSRHGGLPHIEDTASTSTAGAPIPTAHSWSVAGGLAAAGAGLLMVL